MYRVRAQSAAPAALLLTAWLLAWPLRAAYLAFLSVIIWDTRRYLAECQADGLIQSLSLTAFNAQLEADIARADAVRRTLRRLPC